MKNQLIEMGSRIRLRRKELLLKQTTLAEILEISNNHMSSIESGKQKPSLDIFIKLCDSLRVTPDYLLLGNMHSHNVTQDIVDGLRLCSKEDIDLLREIVAIMVKRNQQNWNQDHYI